MVTPDRNIKLPTNGIDNLRMHGVFCENVIDLRFEVLTAVNTKIVVFWVVTLCEIVAG
jgi:hypothetical protein